MKIIFSNPLELGKVGAGRPYGYLLQYLLGEKVKEKGHQVEYINGLELVRGLYGNIPAEKDFTESLGVAAIADLMASCEKLKERLDIFLGAGCASLAQLREILYRFDGRTNLITTWFSSHHQFAKNVLEAEYRRFGIKAAPPMDPFLMWRNDWERRYSDALIVPSQACAETYEADSICKGKVRVVNFGVDSNLFHPAEQQTADFRVLYAGGNWIRKGLLYLLEAWNQLQLNNGVLTCLGTADPGVRAWRTVYPLWVPDEQVPEYYRSNSVFVLPTLEEGQALVVLEAMASGLAVITTKESGAPIESGHNGIIVPSRDVNAIKDAISRLYADPKEVERLGINARETVETMTWERFGEGILKVCEEFNPQIHNSTALREPAP